MNSFFLRMLCVCSRPTAISKSRKGGKRKRGEKSASVCVLLLRVLVCADEKNALLSEMRGSVGCFADNGSPPTALTEWQTSGEFVSTWYGEMLCLRECMFVRVSEFERCVCISVFSLFWGLTFVPIRKEMRAVLRCGAYGLLCESVLRFTFFVVFF